MDAQIKIIVVGSLCLVGCFDPVFNLQPIPTSTITAQTTIVKPPSPTPSVTPKPSPTPTRSLLPCQGKYVEVGNENVFFSSYIINTSPTSGNEIYLYQDCTWWASWHDKTWNGGGTAYDAEGTFSIVGDVITFYPSGLSYKAYRVPYKNPSYDLSLNNPELLYSLWTPGNVLNHVVHTGLAFEDWVINTYLTDIGCNGSQHAFEGCLDYRYFYAPGYVSNGRKSYMYIY